MRVKNKDLLISGDALTALAGADLNGRFALRLKRLIPKFNESLEEAKEVRSNMEIGSETDRKMLEDEFELPGTGEKFPEEAIHDVQIRPIFLQDLEWLINFQDPKSRIEVSRRKVLSSKAAIQNVSRARLPGRFARHVKHLIDYVPQVYQKANARSIPLSSEGSTDDSSEEDSSEELSVREKYEQFLDDKIMLPASSIPEEALRHTKDISAYTIDRLDWLFDLREERP